MDLGLGAPSIPATTPAYKYGHILIEAGKNDLGNAPYVLKHITLQIVGLHIAIVVQTFLRGFI